MIKGFDLFQLLIQQYRWRVSNFGNLFLKVNYGVFERAIKSGAKFVEWERFDQVQHSIQKLYPLTKSTKIMLGIVWPDKHVAFPDFLDLDREGKTQKW